MKNRTAMAKAVAMTAVGTLAFAMLSATGAAADPAAAPEPGPDYGNIKSDATGSIIIHKHAFQNPGQQVIGAPDVATALPNPLAGAGFSVTKIDSIDGVAVDLNTQAGWDAITGKVANNDCSVDNAVLGASVNTDLTGVDGVTTSGTLQLGAYLVCETVVPAGVNKKASPFIVTVPFPYHSVDAVTEEIDSKWLYNIHVYPKNSIGSLTKAISPQVEYALGSVVDFPVTADVRAIDGSEYFKYFAIHDNLDSRLTPQAPGVKSVKVDGTDVDPSYYSAVIKGQKVYVVFSNAGLNWLTANAQGKSVEVVFTSTVTGVGNGTITNIANLYTDTSSTQPVPGDPEDPTNPGPDPENPITPGDPSDPTDPNYPGDPENPLPPTPSNEVETVWGEVLLKKVDDIDTTVGLEGAIFQVFESTDPYAAVCSKETIGDAVVLNGTPVVATSNAQGVVSIGGLFVRDENEGTGSLHRCYILQETAAPAGYALPTDPYTVLTVQAGSNDLQSTPILNTKRTFGFLPHTGAAGQVLLMLGGVAGVVVAGGLALVRKRKLAVSAA